MAIPDYQSIMLPLLMLAGDSQDHSIREATDHVVRLFNLSDEERKERLPSGQQPVIDNRVGWARTYLKKAGLLEAPRRAHFRITTQGLQVLAQKPPAIDITFLRQFPSFVSFSSPRRGAAPSHDLDFDIQDESGRTPLESLEYGYQKIRRDLVQEVLAQVKQCSPEFFERLVVDVLLKMGYGGSLEDAGQAIGRSGDGGIDGIIKQDRLGLDAIYVQAKRWENVVGSGEVRNFVGSLVGQSATKGVFISSSSFSKDAIGYVKTIGHKVILIDGETLAQLMVDHDVGVSTVDTYAVKKMDSDYFVEE